MLLSLPVHLLILLHASQLSLASSGDRSFEFTTCTANCAISKCQPHHGSWTSTWGSNPIPLSLYLTRWSCQDDCKYTCMHSITAKAIASGRPVEQYYGKWPFWRYAGMQEPASVVFSVFNLWAHWKGFKTVRRRLPNDHPMKKLYLGWAVLSMNAWIWSAVFHTRDLPITEKLDYFSAALAILSALYYTFIRLFHLYQRPKLTSSPKPTLTPNLPLALTFLLTYAAHITYLTSGPRFDYTYNTIFNLILGLLHNLLWTLYSLPSSASFLRRYPNRPKSYRPNFAWKAGLFVALTTAATSLELFDFPPWAGVLDAHAMWHAVTSPIAYLWYQFLVQDALDGSWRDGGGVIRG
ncbi:hypothetical protein MD484_g4456, partial [Candolleomyces efflorescens]